MMAACALSACGGGDASADTSPTTTTAPPASQSPIGTKPDKLKSAAALGLTPPVNIEYYGDSTIWGLNVDGSHTQYVYNPPAVLQTELRARCGFQVNVINGAVPGTYASQLLYGSSQYGGVAWDARLAASTSQVFIPGGYGINDSAGYADVPSYKYQMTQLMYAAKAHGKIVIVETPNPVVNQGSTLPQQVTTLPQMVQALRDAALSQGVPLVDNYTRFETDPNIAQDFPDGIHPTQQIAVNKAMRVADVVEKAICP